ncbi:hypothetical protein GYMLUDRAFT_263873 [Collybiopsis luxurians FD-317 M1]|uniref:Guanine deaminase n=1 Tax=Collybiopsis luxurians FD-317 M1 TaxID=944289 RepID=A0A0D0C1J0_9AGAR|nr:hypothetical protein GYMLUDRAFT_263873 [Collybiopsis luxurians FD-317 M1]
MASSHSVTVYWGSLINPKTLTCYDACPNSLIAVSSVGNILWTAHDVGPSQLSHILVQHGCPDAHIVRLNEGQFLMPGFIDTHTHAAQVPIVGTGYGLELLKWLNELVFPCETKFKDKEYAEEVYPLVVKRFIASGTTTCCYYGSLHLEATNVLATAAHSLGQRALIGKCNMDKHTPGDESDYIECSAAVSIEHTHAFIHHVHSLSPGPSEDPKNPLIYPILTPRFALSCSDDLLKRLQHVATSHPHLHIQTHISENPKEVEEVKKRFGCDYAEVYNKYGLLRHNTILGHAVYLNDKEIDLIVEKKAGVSHCPISNFNLKSGVAPIGKYLDRGVKVGLGTDVSGGFSSSMLDAMRDASIASTVLALQNNPSDAPEQENKFANQQLPIATLLYLATLGGAEVCALEHHIGSLDRGKSFDALIVDLHHEAVSDLKEMLGRFIFAGDNRNISAVYVQGKLVGGTSHCA